LREHYERGLNRLLVRLFTGAGKTSAIAAKLPETFPVLARYGVLFLSHRREILQQAYAVFEASYAGFKWCGIDMGEREATGLEDFVFGSFDALGRLTSNRILKYSRRYFGIVIVDEGHHATKEGTWDNVLNYFGVGSDKTQHIRLPGSNLKPLSVFLTATPQRHDGRPLHPFLDAVAADYDIRYAIREGWLTDIMAYRATFDAFDYDKMSDAEQTDFIIKMWERYAKGMRTLVFARSVDQSALIAGTINKFFAGEGHKAAHVSSRGVFGPDGLEAATENELRECIVDRFGLPYGDPDAIDVCSNRLIFTEGYDNRRIQAIIDNAPTQSQVLYLQKIGRGLRPSQDARVDDHVTARARREAIRKSQKPFLVWLTTYPPAHGLDMPAAVFAVPENIKLDGAMTLAEIVDIIENEEREMPEAPARSLDEFGNINIQLRRVDVWTQTVYNDELKALSPLRWVYNKGTDGQEWIALRIPRNAMATSANEKTPAILQWYGVDGGYRARVITEGGWVDQLGRPVRPTVREFTNVVPDMNSAVQNTDAWLKGRDPLLYAEVQRHGTAPAGEKVKAYLRRNNVPFKDDMLSEETAAILVDNFKIRKKLADVL